MDRGREGNRGGSGKIRNMKEGEKALWTNAERNGEGEAEAVGKLAK